jgi:SnoaL-like protein
MSQENVEIVRQGADAWRGVDLVSAFEDPDFLQGLEAFAALMFAPEFEFRFVGPPPLETAGAGRGLEGFVRAWRDWLSDWETFQIDPGEPVDVGDGRVLVPLRLSGRARVAGMTLQERSAAIYTFRSQKLRAWDAYLYESEALAAVGLSE